MDSQLIPTQPIKSKLTVDHGNQEILRPGHKMELSEQKISDIQEHFKSRNRPPDKYQEVNIRCQCGWNGEESAMVRPRLLSQNHLLK